MFITQNNVIYIKFYHKTFKYLCRVFNQRTVDIYIYPKRLVKVTLDEDWTRVSGVLKMSVYSLSYVCSVLILYIRYLLAMLITC